jgi:hypothetical protein
MKTKLTLWTSEKVEGVSASLPNGVTRYHLTEREVLTLVRSWLKQRGLRR